MLVRQALVDCPAPVVDVAELLVSELVTNTVRHAGTAGVLHIALVPRVRVTVEDDSVDELQQRPAPADDDTGRGLAIVDALSAAWGWERTATGKRIWFEL
jgi:anti-sigma regulatory factor (Ser/Thr protein kinase)